MGITKVSVRALLIASLALLACPLTAYAASPQEDEMQIDEQPGYTPTPEEEDLKGPYERQVVFFDENCVVEAHAMTDPTPTADSVLFQDPETGGGFSGVQDPRARALDRLGIFRRPGGDSREALKKI